MFDFLEELREVNNASIVLRIALSILAGGVIGFERGMKNRPAGLRTYMLVCLGACIVMMTNQYIFQTYQAGDPVRMGAQVVSGIGFLGAGTIIITRRNQIKGLTTAAGLWAAACIGLALGIGFYEAAILGGIMIFVILTVLQRIDNRMRRKTRVAEVYVELSEQALFGRFLRHARDNGIEISNIQTEHDDNLTEKTFAFVATLKGKQKQSHEAILYTMRSVEGVVYIEEL